MSHAAFVIPTLDRLAGAERQVLALATGLRKRKWRVSVVALAGSGGGSPAELRAADVQFVCLEMRKGLADPRGWLRFHRWVARERPDILHAHLPHAAWLARWSRLFAAVPVLIDSVHTSATGTLSRRIGYRVSNWLTDRVSAVSQGAADAYRKARMVSADRLILVPNGIDVDRWRPDSSARAALRQRLSLTKEFLWLAVGRLDPVKDYPALLRAMMEVPSTSFLVIAGAGPEEGDLRRLANQFDLTSRVCFLGFEPDVLPWMQAADGFVLSSRWEGLPMSLLEAGACALPAVATDVPGSREVIVRGTTGFLTAAGQPLSLGAAMTRMMHLAHNECAAMGKNARQHILQHFSLEAVLDRWETLYRESLEVHARPARWSHKAKHAFRATLPHPGDENQIAPDSALFAGASAPCSVPAITQTTDTSAR